MLPNAFIGRSVAPTDVELAKELGPAKSLWDRLLSELSVDFGLTLHEWSSYSPKAGWALRVKQRDRNIVYLSPSQGCFLASFALGDKALASARVAKLPKAVIQIIDEAKRYAEGTAVRLEVRKVKDLAPIKKLVAAKLGTLSS